MWLTALLAMSHRGARRGMSLPGSFRDRLRNPPGKRRKKIFVEPIAPEEWKFYEGDIVEILKGKDKGKQGRVIDVIKERNWVVVRGLNTHYRLLMKTDRSPGMFIQSEAPLLVNDVALIEPADRKATPVEWRYTAEGERVRVSTLTGRIIPLPPEQRKDGIIPSQWKAGPKDTLPEHAVEKTYKASLLLFEEELMQNMGIVEPRRPRKSYWY
uniref:large ribosomal subunit protein uL24m n=1 Tax=Myxine glutinosa TaxID=7769 RepID=UPI00358E3F5C